MGMAAGFFISSLLIQSLARIENQSCLEDIN